MDLIPKNVENLIWSTGLDHPTSLVLSSAVTDHLEDHFPRVLNAGAQLHVALLHVGTNEEEAAVSNLRQAEGLVEIRDAAGTWKILETGVHVKVKQS